MKRSLKLMFKTFLLMLVFSFCICCPALPTEEPSADDEITPVPTPAFDYSKVVLVAEHDASTNSSKAMTLSVDFEWEGTTFQWYECDDAKMSNSKKIDGATARTFELKPIEEHDVKYFVCAVFIDGQEIGIKPFVVAYTGLPTLYLDTTGGAVIADKENWISARFRLEAEGLGENFENLDIATEVKGRGNTTWGLPKKPYALKLSKKNKVLGMPSDKRWVLIANYWDNSFIKNEMAFYFSRELKMDYSVRGEFVDLVLNGKYLGLYWLGEHIKVAENRVNIDEKNDFLIELDSHYDEKWKLKSEKKQLPFNIKNDDYMSDEKLAQLQEAINSLEEKLYNEESFNWEETSAMLDLKSFARFWFVNELMLNWEINHPKSSYATFNIEKNIFALGPVWDFDFSVLAMERVDKIEKSLYFDSLFKRDEFKAIVKEVWLESGITSEKIAAKANDLKTKISIAQKADREIWGIHGDAVGIARPFDSEINFVISTLKERCNWINLQWQ